MLLRRAAEDAQRQQRVELLEHAAREGLAESLHELKAPLHAAAGFLDLVTSEQTGPLNDLQKDFLETARGECTRLKDALASLVEVGALAARQSPSPLGAEALVADALQRVRGQSLERGIRLVSAVDPTTHPVVGDRTALGQVFGNFLQNALRLAPTDSDITVGARSVDGWTQFSVEDRGPGVPEDQLQTIFDRFAQGQPAGGKRREPGQVGLGLAIARRIVEEHDGRIWAENRRDGPGARFCFALPVAV